MKEKEAKIAKKQAKEKAIEAKEEAKLTAEYAYADDGEREENGKREFDD